MIRLRTNMQIFLQNMHANMQEKSTKYACFMQIFFNLKYSIYMGLRY